MTGNQITTENLDEKIYETAKNEFGTKFNFVNSKVGFDLL